MFNGAQGLIPLEAKPACEIEDSCVLAHSGRSRAACPEDESKIALFGTVTRLFQRVNALLSATHSRRPLLRPEQATLAELGCLAVAVQAFLGMMVLRERVAADAYVVWVMLRGCGTHERLGSLCHLGALLFSGSLKEIGALTQVGSLTSRGTLKGSGSLEGPGALIESGSLSRSVAHSPRLVLLRLVGTLSLMALS